MDEHKITTQELKAALLRSGYFLETRALEVLNRHGFKNFPNKTYPDGITGKSREIDLYSESERITDNLRLNEFLHFEIQYHIICECINNLQPIVFFKRPDKNPFTIFGKFIYSKFEREIIDPEYSPSADYSFLDFTTSSKKFHLNMMEANTQYCSFTLKKGKENEWMASHSDGLHDTFNKLLDFTFHSKAKYDDWIPKSAWREGVFTLLQFPVLLIQNEIYEASETKDGIIIEKKSHIIFEFNRFMDYPQSLLIDVVTAEYFEKYLTLLKKDMLEIKKILKKTYVGSIIGPYKAPKA